MDFDFNNEKTNRNNFVNDNGIDFNCGIDFDYEIGIDFGIEDKEKEDFRNFKMNLNKIIKLKPKIEQLMNSNDVGNINRKEIEKLLRLGKEYITSYELMSEIYEIKKNEYKSLLNENYSFYKKVSTFIPFKKQKKEAKKNKASDKKIRTYEKYYFNGKYDIPLESHKVFYNKCKTYKIKKPINNIKKWR